MTGSGRLSVYSNCPYTRAGGDWKVSQYLSFHTHLSAVTSALKVSEMKDWKWCHPFSVPPGVTVWLPVAGPECDDLVWRRRHSLQTPAHTSKVQKVSKAQTTALLCIMWGPKRCMHYYIVHSQHAWEHVWSTEAQTTALLPMVCGLQRSTCMALQGWMTTYLVAKLVCQSIHCCRFAHAMWPHKEHGVAQLTAILTAVISTKIKVTVATNCCWSSYKNRKKNKHHQNTYRQIKD